MLDPNSIRAYFTPSIQLDLIALAVLLFFTIRGIRRGLVMSISGVVGLITGILGGIFLADVLSKPFSELLLPFIRRAVSGAAANRDLFQGIAIDGEGNLLSEAAKSISNIISGAELPKFALPGILVRVGEKIAETGADLLQAVAQAVSERIAYLIIFVFAFFALQLLVFVLFKAIDLAAKVPVIKTLNGWGGAVLGLVSGLAFSAFLLWFIATFFTASTSDGGILSPNSIEQSFITKYLLQIVYRILP